MQLHALEARCITTWRYICCAAYREAVLFNWLFAGSEGGAKVAATMFSIVGSCVMNGIDPYDYLRDVLHRLPDAKPEDLKHLTPAAWAGRHGPANL